MRVWEAGGAFDLEEGFAGCERTLIVPEPVPQNEAFIVPSDVCYVGAGTNRTAIEAVPFDGTTNIVTRVLSYDCLWNEVRVKGGAYGAGFKATRTGTVMFYSFRDPNLDHTVEVLPISIPAKRNCAVISSVRLQATMLRSSRVLSRSVRTTTISPAYLRIIARAYVPRCSRPLSKIFVRAAGRSSA